MAGRPGISCREKRSHPSPNSSSSRPSWGWGITDNRIYNTKDRGTRWNRQLRSPQKLKAIEFVDELNGLAIAAEGTIWRTTVGGHLAEQGAICAGFMPCEEEEDATWDRIASGTTSELNDIAFLEGGHAWIAGDKGLILRSVDGGASWATVDTGVDTNLLSLDFISASTGVAVGDGGTILFTADAGETWQSSNSATSTQLNDVAFSDEGSVWAVGDGGTALHSSDGGVNWTEREIADSLTVKLHSVDFEGARGAITGVDGTMFGTSDSGTSWVRQSVTERVAGSATREVVPTHRPLSGLALHLDEEGELMVWATSDENLWEWGLLGGNFGKSPRHGTSISGMVAERLPKSAILALAAFVVAVPLSVAAGVIVGIQPDTKVDRVLSQLGLLTISVPEFVTGVLLMLIFASTLGWLPSSSVFTPGETVWGSPEKLVLPVLTVTGALFAYVQRMARANVMEVMNSNYVRTAILKGLPMRRVVIRHVLPNAMLPTITVIANNVGWMFGGLIIVETVFAYPGIGSLLLMAIGTRDVRLLQSTALVIAGVTPSVT